MLRKTLIGAAAILLAAVTTAPAMAAVNIIHVTNTNDSVITSDGCSLREAIENANAGDHGQIDCEAGVAGPDTNEIDFSLSAGSTINVTTILSVTAAGTFINGASATGCTTPPCITLDAGGGSFDMLSLQADSITVKGLKLVNDPTGSAIVLTSSASNAVIQGNSIGTADGVSAAANLYGIDLAGGDSAQIGGSGAGQGNLISGNSLGIFVEAGSDNTVIQGNLIGTDSTGAFSLHNGTGVQNQAGGTLTIGGSGAGQRNVISGNLNDGILVYNTSAVTTIQGNLIGTNSAGTAALGNGSNGIEVLLAPNTVIGGLNSGEGNVISGNIANGITVTSSNNVHIIGNKIGTNSAGTAAVANLNDGISSSTSSSPEIKKNLVSGNLNGMTLVNATNLLLTLNKVGTNAAGTAAIPNLHNGVVVDTSTSVAIGGSGAGNQISGNGNHGLVLMNATGGWAANNLVGTNAAGTGALPNGSAGPGFAGVQLSTGAQVQLSDNLIAHQNGAGNYGIAIADSGTVINGGSINNCLIDNKLGVTNVNGDPQTFSGNWWNSGTGPRNASLNPAGTGDPVSAGVDFSGFLVAPPAACSSLYGAPPTLTRPKEGYSTPNKNVTLGWRKVKGVTQYQVELDDDPAFGSPSNFFVTKTSKPLSGLAYGKYYWKARGNAGLSTRFSSARSFYVTIMRQPKLGKVMAHSPTPRFSWKATKGTFYTLLVYTGSNCSAVLHTYPSLTGGSFKVPAADALPPNTYSWQVQAGPTLMPCWSFTLKP